MSKKIFDLIVESIPQKDIEEAAMLVVYSDGVSMEQLEWFRRLLHSELGDKTPVLASFPHGDRIDTLSDETLKKLGMMRDYTHPLWKDREEIKGTPQEIKVLSAQRRKESKW